MKIIIFLICLYSLQTLVSGLGSPRRPGASADVPKESGMGAGAESVEDMKAENQHLKKTLTEVLEQLKDLKAKTLKSSICGWQSEWRSIQTISYETVHTEVEEVGSSLNATTGVFTAGVDGVYQISVSGTAKNGPSEEVVVELDGAGYGIEDDVFIYSHIKDYSYENVYVEESVSQTRHLTLKAGQQISLNYIRGPGYFFRIKFCVTLY